MFHPRALLLMAWFLSVVKRESVVAFRKTWGAGVPSMATPGKTRANRLRERDSFTGARE